jgi:hypothetical protein
MRLYRRLATPDAIDEKRLVAWIRGIMDGFAAQKKYITIMKRALAMDQSLLGRIFAERRRFILHMGKKIPQLHIFDDDGLPLENRLAEMQLLLLELEDISEHAAFGAWNETIDFVVKRLAQKLLDFGRAGEDAKSHTPAESSARKLGKAV